MEVIYAAPRKTTHNHKIFDTYNVCAYNIPQFLPIQNNANEKALEVIHVVSDDNLEKKFEKTLLCAYN